MSGGVPTTARRHTSRESVTPYPYGLFPTSPQREPCQEAPRSCTIRSVSRLSLPSAGTALCREGGGCRGSGALNHSEGGQDLLPPLKTDVPRKAAAIYTRIGRPKEPGRQRRKETTQYIRAGSIQKVSKSM